MTTTLTFPAGTLTRYAGTPSARPPRGWVLHDHELILDGRLVTSVSSASFSGPSLSRDEQAGGKLAGPTPTVVEVMGALPDWAARRVPATRTRPSIDGHTADGTHVVFRDGTDRPVDAYLEVDGTAVAIDRVDTMRDGGTRHYRTSAGTLTFPHRINSDDRTPRWCDSPITPR